jgi:hypothetical protein
MDGQALEDLYVPLSQRRRELRLDVGVERKPGGRIIMIDGALKFL